LQIEFQQMPIPDYQTCMLDLLRLTSDGAEHTLKDAVPALADIFQLTNTERTELLPSGQQAVFHNRVAWANTYLKKAELLRSPRRGVFTITDRGKKVLAQNPPKIDLKLLEQFPEFLAFKAKSKTAAEDVLHLAPSAAIETPLESLEAAYAKIRGELKAELLDRLKLEAPAVFERVVIALLVKMGYGGSRADAAEAIGKPGDEGLDGFIKKDRLGLDIIYVQAKRWAGTVGRPDIQKFAGALHGQHSTKGIFITTSDFSREADEYVAKIGSKIVLIDGSRLAELMIEFGVGVATDATYTVERIDNDFFDSV
jgi:restriction system protein